MSSASLTIVVTRSDSIVGHELARRIAGEPGTRVVGLASSVPVAPSSPSAPGAPTAPPGADPVDRRAADLGSPSVVRSLEDVDVLVHLAWDHDLGAALSEQAAVRRSRMLGETRTLVTAAAAAGVPHVVLVSSAVVFGARPDNPVPLPEDCDLRAPDTEGLVADLVAVEHELVRSAAHHPGLTLTRVRPSTLVGPGVDTPLTRHFESPRLLVLKGTHPRWSFCHLDDLATALHTVATRRLAGEISVSAPGSLDEERVEELSGLRRIEVAEAAAYAAADRLHRLGVVPVPSSDLAYVSHPWVSDPVRLLAAGWRARHDHAACLAVLLDGVRGHHAVMARRVRSRDAVSVAAAGAASAAVAALATAALRRRRRGRS